MDATIAFNCEPAPIEGDPQTTLLKVSILINGEAKGEEIVNVVDFVFGAIHDYAHFYPFTCDCGIPGCAGFFDSVRQRRENSKVIWQVFDSKTKAILGAEDFSFDAKSYDMALKKLKSELEKAEAGNSFPVMSLSYGPDGRASGTRLSQRGAWARQFHRSFDEVAKICASALRKNAPRSIAVSYPDGEVVVTPIERFALHLCDIGAYSYPVDADRFQELRDAVGILQEFARSANLRSAYSAVIKKVWHGRLSMAKTVRWRFALGPEEQAMVQLVDWFNS